MNPAIQFKLIPEDLDITLVEHFTKPQSNGWDWSRYIYEMNPGLENRIDAVDSSSSDYVVQRRAAIESYVKGYYAENAGVLDAKVLDVEKNWSVKHEKFVQVLSDVIELDWPDRAITGYVSGVCTINPRFLDSWSFSVFHRLPLTEIVGTIAHEMTHFLYFEKWKEVFPEADPNTFEAPHLVWHLSEILAPVMLNDSRVAEVILDDGCKVRAYDVYDRMMVGDKCVFDYFSDLYLDHKRRGGLFSDFLIHANKEAERYGEIILAGK